MKQFTFTVDDNIKFLKELNNSSAKSIFEHPYMHVYKQLHDQFNLKVQMNLFYREGDFNLSMMTNRFKDEWQQNSNWLKLSFHSDYENEDPYIQSGYDEVFSDCKKVQDEIVRFAGKASLGTTTTVHYCTTTLAGNRALLDNGIKGVLGLYGTEDEPCVSYSLDEENAQKARRGETVKFNGLAVAGIDIVLNDFSIESVLNQLKNLNGRPLIKVMMHEQYFYPSFCKYMPHFKQHLESTFKQLIDYGYTSVFFEETL